MGGFNQQNTNSKDVTPRAFRDLRQPVADLLADRAQGLNIPSIEGPFVAPLGQGEIRGLNAFENNVFDPTGFGAAQDDFLSKTLSGGEQNPFLDETIAASIRPLLESAELSELRDRALFTQGGQKIQGSSAFTEDRLRDIRETERNIGDVASRLAFQDQTFRQQQQVQAAALAGERVSQQRDAIATLALPRLVEQMGIDKGNAELARRFQVIERAITQIGQLSSATPVTTGDGFGFSILDILGGGDGGSTATV